jgi:hypothetical protein
MYFGCMYRTIFKANCCKSFHLSPTPSPISLMQACETSDGASGSDYLNVRNLPDYFKIHRVCIKPLSPAKLKQPSNRLSVYSLHPQALNGPAFCRVCLPISTRTARTYKILTCETPAMPKAAIDRQRVLICEMLDDHIKQNDTLNRFWNACRDSKRAG